MPQLADAMLCGYGSDAMEDVGTTFEAIPQSIVRDEVLKHADGAALSAAASASKALRTAAGDAGRAQLQRRFAWLWPSASKPDGPRPRNAAPAGALRLLEEDGSFVLACGTREEAAPTADAAAVRPAPPRPTEEMARRRHDDALRALGVPRLHDCSTARNAPAACRANNGDVWLCGGWADGEALQDCEFLDASRRWRRGPRMDAARCFAAAAVPPFLDNAILVVGGGDTLWVGGTASRECEILDLDEGTSWAAFPSLTYARCGHGLASVSKHVVACGGYGGGDAYLDSVEVCSGERWQVGAKMNFRRTGAGVGAGPDGCVYAAGGSPDGQDALASAERWDLRTSRWELLPPMARGRGYVAAAFDASGNFVVHGGYGETGDVGADAEAFDIRAHRWRPVDLAHSAQTQYYGQNGAGRTRWYLDRAQHGLVFTVV